MKAEDSLMTLEAQSSMRLEQLIVTEIDFINALLLLLLLFS